MTDSPKKAAEGASPSRPGGSVAQRRPSRLVGPATARLQREAWEALDAAAPPAAAGLIDLIHRINPTARELDAADRAERYDLKHQLQSLLVRKARDFLVVEVNPADPRVVGLRHRRLPLDACHAVVQDLDDDARSWVQFQIDTLASPSATASPAIAATEAATSRPEHRGAEGWLQVAAAFAADYDYDAARAAYLRAFEEAGGSVGTALPLVELLIEILGEFSAALALLPRMHLRGPGIGQVHALLAIAAVHEKQLDLAEQLLGDATGILPCRALALLAEASVATGELERMRRVGKQARRAGPVSAALLALEKHLENQREQLRAPAEQAILAWWASGNIEGAKAEAVGVLERYPDSAIARRLLRDAETRLREERQVRVRGRAQKYAEVENWEEVVEEIEAVPFADWDDALRSLHAQASSVLREAERTARLQPVLQLFRGGDRVQALRAWWDLSEPASQRDVELAMPSPCFDWLRDLRAAGRRPAESVAAVLAFDAVLARPATEQRDAMAVASRHYPALHSVTRANRLVESLAQAETVARRDAQRRSLAAVQALADADRWSEASAALRKLDIPAGPLAPQRDQLATTIGSGLAAEHAMAQSEAQATAGNLFEAAHFAELAAARQPRSAVATAWLQKAEALRSVALRGYPFWVEETPHGAPNLLPLGLCARPEHLARCINGLGQVLLSTMMRGIAYMELLEPNTSKVIRRGVVDTQDHV